MANRNWLSQKMYQMEAYPVLVSCTFKVDSTSGTGVTNLKGGTVKSVIMNSSTPAPGHTNPIQGIIQITLQDNYSKLLGVSTICEEPLSGVALSTVASGDLYTISNMGGTTVADWQSLGLPAGVVPAVGVMFLANTDGPIPNGGQVQTTLMINAPEIALAGNANVMLQNTNSSVNGGAVVILTTRQAGALEPLRNGTVVRVNMYLSNSSVTVQGQ